MSLLKLKTDASTKIAPAVLFDGPVQAALTARGPEPGAGRCAFLIVEAMAQEGYTVDLETAEVYPGVAEDAACKLVLHASAFDALVRGKGIDGTLSALEGGAEIYGDPDLLDVVATLLLDAPRGRP